MVFKVAEKLVDAAADGVLLVGLGVGIFPMCVQGGFDGFQFSNEASGPCIVGGSVVVLVHHNEYGLFGVIGFCQCGVAVGDVLGQVVRGEFVERSEV